MNYKIIEKPPQNFSDYVKVAGTNCREEFIKSLCGLLKQGVPYIYTESIPIEWAVSAEQASNYGTYYLMMLQRVPVNFGELGTDHGIFYFERQPENKNPN